jgi:excisionase family DNA binding protein
MGNDLTPVTPKEAAEILGINKKSVYEGIKKGEIPHFALGRLFLIPRPAFNELLRSGRFGAAPHEAA